MEPPIHRPLAALVIGINNYPGLPLQPDGKSCNLKGAVADAEAVTSWLIDDMHVDMERITTLLNEEATRDNILDAISRFKDYVRIKPGNPILIYFAGHGCMAKTPSDWEWQAQGGAGEAEGDGRIKCLLPHDAYTGRSQVHKGIQPIPIITIAGLLRELAVNKGDNIAVILDCCFLKITMRGGGLEADAPLTLLRCVDLRKLFDHDATVLPRELDYDILERTDFPFEGGDQATHVLLTASRSIEQVFESGETHRGWFTACLLEELTHWDDQTTYSELIQALPYHSSCGFLWQYPFPQCVGVHEDRRLFDGDLPGRDPAFIPINCICSRVFGHLEHRQLNTPTTMQRHVNGRTVYEHICSLAPLFLDAGDAQGVVQDARYTVHGDFIYPDNPPLCTARVTRVGTSIATLELVSDDNAPTTLPIRIYAKQVEWTRQEALRLHCTPALSAVLDDGVLTSPPGEFDSKSGILMETESRADLVLDLRDNVIVFHYRHEGTLFPLTEYTAPPTHDELVPILRSAVSWRWHLERGEKLESNDVVLKFHRLAMITGGICAGTFETKDEISHEDGIMHLADDAMPYGFELETNTESDYSVTVFWFDCAMLGIVPLYRSAKNRKEQVDPTLVHNGKSVNFTVGYGLRGSKTRPLTFRKGAANGVTVAAGFLKAFIVKSPSQSTAGSEGAPDLPRDFAQPIVGSADQPPAELTKKPAEPSAKPCTMQSAETSSVRPPEWGVISVKVMVG